MAAPAAGPRRGGPAERGDDAELELWLAPFLDRLGHRARRRWAPVYVRGLLHRDGKKSVTSLAERLAPRDVQQLHHFVATSSWDTEPLRELLIREADRLVGGPGATLVISETALVKRGRHSVGVARQYCGELGRRENCQLLVTVTLARGGVGVGAGVELYLPAEWAADPARRRRVGVPESAGHRPKWRVAVDELDRVLDAGARFDDVVVDAALGSEPELWSALEARGVSWAVVLGSIREVRPADVPAEAWLAAAERRGGKGRRVLFGRLPEDPAGAVTAALRACRGARRVHAWLKALGLDRFEGRSWHGLRHHAVLVGMAHGFRRFTELADRSADRPGAMGKGAKREGGDA